MFECVYNFMILNTDIGCCTQTMYVLCDREGTRFMEFRIRVYPIIREVRSGAYDPKVLTVPRPRIIVNTQYPSRMNESPVHPP